MLRILIAITCAWAMLSSQALACSSFDDEQLIKERNACEQDSSRKWSCELNRCVTTVEAKQARDDYKACAELASYEERKKCHDKYALEYSGVETEKEPPYMIGAGVSAALATLMVLNIAAAKNAKGRCISKYILAATGGAGVMSEIYFQMSAKKQLEELEENYQKEQELSNSFHQQVRALEYLKQEQEMVADYSKNRKAAYMMLTAGYGMSVAAAIFDMRKPSCGGKSEGAEGAEGGAEGGADGTSAQGPASGEVSGASVSSAGVSQAMGHPVGIIMMAGVGLGVSAYLWKAAHDQEELAKENAKKVQAMIDKFNALMAGHCPAGRDNYESLQTSPRCYCYTNEGKRNSDRSKSETCQALWESDAKNYYIAGNSYGALSGKKERVGCMAVTGEFDEKCACKSLKNKKGESACLKVPVQVTLTEPGLSVGAKSFAQTVNGINTGTMTPADLDHSELEKMATRVNKLNKTLLPDALKEAKANFASDLKFGDKFSDDFIRAMNKSDAQAALAHAGPFSLAAMNGDRLKKALDPSALELASEQLNPKAPEEGAKMAGGQVSQVKKKEKNNLSFDFSETKRVEEFAQAAQSDSEKAVGEMVKYQDINDSGESLWQILTKRYQLSGIRRLFPHE